MPNTNIRCTLPPAHYSGIHCHDLYDNDDPWEIFWRLQFSGEEPADVYALTELKEEAKSDGGVNKRAIRKVGRSGGNWHDEGIGTLFKLVCRARSPIEHDERWIGTRKRFSYQNPNPQFAGENAKWILHQFSMRRDDAHNSDDEREVMCMIRNNGSPMGNVIKEAARQSVLIGRKRKLNDYIRKFSSSSGGSDDTSTSTNSSSKRVCYSNSASNQSLQQQHKQEQEPPLTSTKFDCSNQVAPLPTVVLQPQQLEGSQPVQEENLDELDVTSSINFDYPDEEFDWGDQGCGGVCCRREYWY